MTFDPHSFSAVLAAVRQTRPLVHHLTNPVTINDCANIVLAAGGAPVMTEASGEAAEMATHAHALVLNLGTPHPRQLEAMLLAGRRANERGIPVVLDPVGAGATPLRRQAAEQLLRELRITVLRGNLAEIKTLAGEDASGSRGVDSTAPETAAEQTALAAARRFHCVVAITGRIDVITDGTRLLRLANGHEILTRITGTGCMATALIGTCLGACPEQPLVAAATGLAMMGLAGEIAHSTLCGEEGTGTAHVRIFDAVSTLTPARLAERLKLTVADSVTVVTPPVVAPKLDLRLNLVTDRGCVGDRDFYAVVEAALRGGVTLLQLREKECPSGEFLAMARRLRELAHRYNVPLIINDRLDIALAADADGLHLGQSDLPASVARRLLRPGMLLGVSAKTVAQAIQAEKDGADYLGSGAVYPTTTKVITRSLPLDELRQIRAAVRIPVVAIGGINAANAAPVLACGVAGLAVVSAIMKATDPEAAARELRTLNSPTFLR